MAEVRIRVALTRDEAALLLRYLRRVGERNFEAVWDEDDPTRRQRAREFMELGDRLRGAILMAGVDAPEIDHGSTSERLDLSKRGLSEVG
jgi:hypothetical protein